MKFLSFIALASLAISAVYSEQKCGENEVWADCASPCQENCLTRGFIIGCVRSCFSGCVCREGFTRRGWDSMGGNGDCVASTTCDALIRNARNGPMNH